MAYELGFGCDPVDDFDLDDRVAAICAATASDPLLSESQRARIIRETREAAIDTVERGGCLALEEVGVDYGPYADSFTQTFQPAA